MIKFFHDLKAIVEDWRLHNRQPLLKRKNKALFKYKDGRVELYRIDNFYSELFLPHVECRVVRDKEDPTVGTMIVFKYKWSSDGIGLYEERSNPQSSREESL